MSKLNILLADDDADDCIFFQEALEELELNAKLTTVANGEQLMQWLQNNSPLLPDILFLDLNMPRKNGSSCLVEIKQNDKLKQLPVVIYTTSFDEKMADMLYNNGAHYYICKPADYSSLKRVIHHAILEILKEKQSQPHRKNFLLSNLKTFLW